MPNTCPECGAALAEGANCQEILDSFLAREFADPAYGEVHMLSVACFMIQHGRYSDEALAWIAPKLHASLEGVPVQQIRQQAARETAPSARTWKVLRPPDAPPRPRVAWSMTIADVAPHAESAASYCRAVRQWAAATLREMPSWPRPAR